MEADGDFELVWIRGPDLRGARPPDAQRFQSILFERAEDGVRVDGLSEPDFFADLNLDQVLKSMTTGREQYELKPFFYAPLHEVGGSAIPAGGPARPREARRARVDRAGSPSDAADARAPRSNGGAPLPAAEAGVVSGHGGDLLPGGPLAREQDLATRPRLARLPGTPRLRRRVRRLRAVHARSRRRRKRSRTRSARCGTRCGSTARGSPSAKLRGRAGLRRGGRGRRSPSSSRGR